MLVILAPAGDPFGDCPTVFHALHHCVVFADCRADFMKVVAADVSDTGMQVLYFALCLLPVVTKLHLTAHLTLEFGEFLLIGFKAVYRLKNGAI